MGIPIGHPFAKQGVLTGKNNLITDVGGVKVGHVTLKNGDINTGVTAIIPAADIFHNKLFAGAHVINGFGKSAGLIQINELGTLETPIMLTNTLSVGAVYDGLVKYMLDNNADIGDTTGTVNPVVMECNDGYLNDIRAMCVEPAHAKEAITNASELFEEGAVGAGTGMRCFGYKGGIGSASRVIRIEEKEYTLGCLVLTNFGRREDLRIYGKRVADAEADERTGEQGSVIAVIATDMPLDGGQLERLSRRVNNGLARLGGQMANGSGEIVLSFSTANIVPHYPMKTVMDMHILHSDYIDLAFRAAGDAAEEAVISSMLHADETTGFRGRFAGSLKHKKRVDA